MDAGDERQILGLKFTNDGGLWVYSLPIIRRWDLSGGAPRLLEEHDLSSPGFIMTIRVPSTPTVGNSCNGMTEVSGFSISTPTSPDS